MSRRSPMTAMAVILRALGSLTDSEKATLRDVLRPEPAPRKAVKKKVNPNSVACGVCGEMHGHPNHDTDHYGSAHPFQSSASAPRAKRQSPRKLAQQPSAASSVIETGTATAAAGSGD